MKFAKNKIMATLIALILMLTMLVSIFTVLPITNAHTPPWTFPTNAYVTCAPSPIGVGQYTSIIVWVDRYSPTAGGGAGQRWDGFKLVITKPDGTNETIGPWQCRSDVGSDYQTYSPDQVGTYTIVFSWPGETAVAPPGLPSTSANIGDFYAGSTSAPAKLVVQQEPIADWQEPPLPTEYWQTPISDANRGWSSLASNWLRGSWLVNNFQRWGTAPESAHVLWSQPIAPGRAGGINDASWPSIPSDVNDYECPWGTPIIMNGKIYNNQPPVADSATYGYYCRDLYTGEIIWYKNGTDNGLNNPFTIGRSGNAYDLGQYYLGGTSSTAIGALTQGQLYHYDSVNGNGILAYLISVQGTTWYFFDAATGNWMLTLKNVPSGTAVTDQDGSLLLYSYNPTTGQLLCWNSSQSIPPLGPLGTNQQQWKMRFGSTIDAVNDTSWTAAGSSSTVPASAIQPRSGYTMNLTVDKGLPGSITILQNENRVPKMIFGSDNPVTASTSGASCTADTFSAWLLRIDEHATAFSPHPEYTASQNTNLGFGATLLWKKNITVPVPGKNYTWSVSGASYGDEIFVLQCQQLRQRWGYSLTSGDLLWGPTPPEGDMNYYGMGNNAYYGKILSTGFTGTIYAYDTKTGNLLWTYNATAPGHEGAYGQNMPLMISAVADGKIYTVSSEHSPTKPLWRASYVRCINATDGKEIWKLLSYSAADRYGTGDALGISNGYLVTASEYDNQIYCIGKGPSDTSITASPKVLTDGSSVLIEGKVNDISPGTKKYDITARFPDGVPAVSDESMETWMEYVYEQQLKPTNATGVPVSIDVLDANGNYRNIGIATTNANGFFSFEWTPDIAGKYTVTTSFAGSRSYYPSYAQTAFTVDEAAPTPTEQPQLVLPPTEMYILGVGAAIIIVIAIGFAITILVLRKRS